jgi:hypothetical protein
VRRIQRDLIVLAASLAVFAGCAVAASDGRVGPAERAVFHAVNGLPGWLYRPMLAAQYLGVLAMPLLAAAFALVWRRWRLAAAPGSTPAVTARRRTLDAEDLPEAPGSLIIRAQPACRRPTAAFSIVGSSSSTAFAAGPSGMKLSSLVTRVIRPA